MRTRELVVAGQTIRLAQSESSGTDGRLWEPAVILTYHLAAMPAITGPAVELGCGLGLVGIVLASRGVEVILTDLPAAEAAARASLRENRAALRAAVDFAVLDWAAPALIGAMPWASRVRFAVASDPVYDFKTLELFVAAVAELFAACPRLEGMLVAHKHRPNVCSDDGAFPTEGWGERSCPIESALSLAGLAVSAVAPLGGLTHPYIVLWNVTRAAKAAPTLDTMETSKREEEPVLRSEQESGVRSWFSLTAFMHSHQFSCLRLSDGNPD